jgi:hypothetical protein
MHKFLFLSIFSLISEELNDQSKKKKKTV